MLPFIDAVSFSGSSQRPTPSTCAPASVNATAVARPMPDPAPVTIATCPAKVRLVEFTDMRPSSFEVH